MSTTSQFSEGQETASPEGAQERVQQAAGQAQEKAQEAAGQAKNRVQEQVDQRSTELSRRASGAADDIRGVADHLRSQGREQPAKLATQAAERVERAGRYLQESDGSRLLSDVEDFGRKRPWAVVAGGAALGFAAARFLKASSQKRYEGGRQLPAQSPPPPAPPSPSGPVTGAAPQAGTVPPEVPPAGTLPGSGGI